MAKYSKILSIRTINFRPNTYCEVRVRMHYQYTNLHYMINKYVVNNKYGLIGFTYHLNKSRRHSSRSRSVPCPAHSANERASCAVNFAPKTKQQRGGVAASLLARKVNRAGNEVAILIAFTFYLRINAAATEWLWNKWRRASRS